jgi:putative flippase GtrA
LQALILYLAGSDYYPHFFAAFTGKTVTGAPYVPPLSIYLTSIMISFIVSILVNYVLSVFFVFEYGNVGRNKRGFLKFCVFSALGLTITTVGSLIGFQGLGANVWLIKIIITLVVFVFNFFTRKYFVFNIALIRDDENTINL